MELFAISGLINAIVSISFGVLVFLKNWRDKQNQVFLLMTGTLAIWGISYWRWLSSTDYESALLWVRLLAVGSVFIPVFFFDWVSLLLQKTKRNAFLVSLAYMGAVAVALFANTKYIISGLQPKLLFPFWPEPGFLYTIYICLLYVFIVIYTLHSLYHRYIEERDEHKRGQVLYVFWGAVLGFGGGFTNFLLWYGIDILPYGTFLVAAFPFLLGFSVVRYGKFNDKSIATEILVFFIGVILFIQFILSGTTLEYILRGSFFLIISFFGILLIRSVYREVEQREKIEKLAKDLEAANERLKELDLLKSEFVSMATHQIRSPLAAIKGYASLITEGDFGVLPEYLREPVNTIFHSSQSLVGIVEDFLNISRIELGRMKYDFSDFDFGSLVSETITELKPSIEARGLILDSKLDDKVIVRGDSGKLKQVISNLVDNSSKYTPKGSIAVTLKNLNNKARLSIKDTGIGIKSDVMPLLFQKFTRAKDAGKTNIMGTGLGLYVAKEMVKAHGGKIWAESEGEGKGSTFIVELDCCEALPETTPAERIASETSTQ